MSLKHWCPACDVATSTFLAAFRRGEDCPQCGLPAAVAAQLLAARERGAGVEVVELAARAEVRALRAERQVLRLQWQLRQIRDAVASADVGAAGG